MEKTVQQKSIDKAKRAGWKTYKLSTPGRRAIMDYMLTKATGKIVFIEFKRKGEEARKNQELRIKEFRDDGFEAHVIDDVEDMDFVLF